MSTVKRVVRFLNPMHHLGERRYPVIFPFLTILVTCALLEGLVYFILKDPNAVGLPAIIVLIALIMYFAFRAGLRGGFIAAGLTILYYFYIIYSRHYTGIQFITAIQTTIVLGVVYFLLAGIIGWLKEKIDILIERESDEKRRLQAIIQQLPVGIVIADRQGFVTEANKKTDEILGIKYPLGFRIGKETLLHGTQNGRPIIPAKIPLAMALATGKSVRPTEFEIVQGKGKQLSLQISASPIHNSHGELIAGASIIHDITQQKILEKRKDDFVNMASHELKTPITSMKLYIEALTEKINDTKDERAIKMLNGIKTQTDRLQKTS